MISNFTLMVMPQSPSKADTEPIKQWVLGKDILKLSGVDDLEVTEDEKALSEHKYGLTHLLLGGSPDMQKYLRVL
jgi:hypothetical protein